MFEDKGIENNASSQSICLLKTIANDISGRAETGLASKKPFRYPCLKVWSV